ncbi:MAG: calcineurin-like phosphoesterase C-terminal domain-containing protein [Capsulimonas sp.]|uniref:calcineurin-like phosphoesterase C-terminal domain-containing protein n=1 Tax=Capsulimonas sp. TaxID=2494211 RepID=UPI00326506AC
MTLLDRRDFLRRSAALAAGVTFAPLLSGQRFAVAEPGAPVSGTFAEGVVFHDRSGSGVRKPGDEGIKGVLVSNGRDVVKTDSNGRYRLPVEDEAIIFVIKPSGWALPVNEHNLVRRHYLHRPNGSPKSEYPGIAPTGPLPASVDFPLLPSKEPSKFRMVLFGDPQPRDQKEVDYIAHDVVEDLIGVDAAFGLSLGDIMFDDLSLYESLNSVIATIGLPWHNLRGNHDVNYDSVDNQHSGETYKSFYGPTYYAFDYGQVHFLILDDVTYEGAAAHRYHGELGQTQLDFIKNDLAFVPKDKLVVVAMHIPLTGVHDREALYRLLEDRPHAMSISAHTHFHQHMFLEAKDGWRGAQPHHHFNHATVCGCWWSGAPDEMGIPHATMTDGGPNGYSFIDFDGPKYSVEFHPARRLPTDQMNIYTPDGVTSANSGDTDVLVNVYAGSPRSVVEMKVGKHSDWSPMRPTVTEDPYYVNLKKAEAGPNPPPGISLPDTGKTDHIWTAKLPAGLPKGTHLAQVRTTDMFGHTYTGRRIITVG